MNKMEHSDGFESFNLSFLLFLFECSAIKLELQTQAERADGEQEMNEQTTAKGGQEKNRIRLRQMRACEPLIGLLGKRLPHSPCSLMEVE